MEGFFNFIQERGVVGLAIGFIIGGAVQRLVTSFVQNIVNPSAGILFGNIGNLSEATWVVGESVISYGSFLAAFLDLIILALIVYLVFRRFGLEKFDKKK